MSGILTGLCLYIHIHIHINLTMPRHLIWNSKTPNIERPEAVIVIPLSAVQTKIMKKKTIKIRQVNPQVIQKVASNIFMKVVQNTERSGTLTKSFFSW